MADIDTADTILKGLAPQKSASTYDLAWDAFKSFVMVQREKKVAQSEITSVDSFGKVPPKEEEYIQYFHYLHKFKSYKASSLWTHYSRLNNCHQRFFGAKLQTWPRLTLLLKNYNVGYTRKTAKVFSRDEILLGLQLNEASAEWVLRKCAIAIAYCGGLRCCELRNLQIGSLKRDAEGVWVTYWQGKQKGEEKKNNFLVPFNHNNPHLCFASRVVAYTNTLLQCIPDLDDTDLLFHSCALKGYGKGPMGKHTLAETGKLLARKLSLLNPEEYTGHCFRRSSATAAANNGANTVDLKRHFGWVQEQTALKYTEETKDRARKMANLITHDVAKEHSISGSYVESTHSGPPLKSAKMIIPQVFQGQVASTTFGPKQYSTVQPFLQPAVQPAVQPRIQLAAQSTVSSAAQPLVQHAAQSTIQHTAQSTVQTKVQTRIMPSAQVANTKSPGKIFHIHLGDGNTLNFN